MASLRSRLAHEGRRDHVNQSIVALRPHPSKALAERAAKCPNAIDLTVGVPSFGPPLVFREALNELNQPGKANERLAIDLYAPAAGSERLRLAIAGHYRRSYGLEVDPAGVVVTNGAAEGLWLSVLTSTDPGDDVLITDPAYMLYEPIVLALGRNAVRVKLAADDPFGLRVEDLEAAPSESPRAVIVNSPMNPTGAVATTERLDEIAEWASTRRTMVIHDEVLDCFTYTHQHTPMIATGDSEAVVCVNSASKRFGATGWRVGWVVGPQSWIREAIKAHTFMCLAVGHAVQEAFAAALEDDPPERIQARCRQMRQTATDFASELAATGLFEECAPPAAGFYLFPTVEGLAAALGVASSADVTVATELFDRLEIMTVPGSAFGSGGIGHLRLSCAGDGAQLANALDRLRGIA
jgi:aspartate/methionine/tyrosine aminotransferase